MKKQSLTANEVKSYLESINPYSEELYISNIKKVINLKKDGFISETLHKILSEIVTNLPNNLFLFKYDLYKKDIIQPFYRFYTKDDLKNIPLLNTIDDDYPYRIFGIRFEFIDEDANRYIFIVIIE